MTLLDLSCILRFRTPSHMGDGGKDGEDHWQGSTPECSFIELSLRGTSLNNSDTHVQRVTKLLHWQINKLVLV